VQIISLIIRIISIMLAGNEHCNSIKGISSDLEFLRSRCYRIITHNMTMAYALTWKAIKRGQTDYEKILLLPNFYMACLSCVFFYYRAVHSTLFCLILSCRIVKAESGIKLADVIFRYSYCEIIWIKSPKILLYWFLIMFRYSNVYCIVDYLNYEWKKMILFDV